MRLIPALFALLLFGSVWAAVPDSLNYQAYLTDRDGSPEVGDTLITFSIYAAEVGGSPLWFDTLNADIENGLMNVQLGRPANPFPVDLFETPLWLGITVESDNEMIPRRRLTSVGFSFKAEDANRLQGMSAIDLDQSTHTDDLTNPHDVTAQQAGAATSADIAILQGQLDAALASIAILQTDLATETTARIAADNAETVARIADVNAEQAARIAADGAQDATITTIQTNTVLSLDGILTHPDSETARFTGVNVQVVNGTGTTDGTPNGAGNVIVGYNTVDTDDFICSLGEFSDPAFTSQEICETRGGIWAQSHKSGSHNVVVGDRHNYSRFGGVAVGLNNNITGEWSSVSAGSNNTASHHFASVSGGSDNTAGAEGSSVSAGRLNTAGRAGHPDAPFNYGVYSSISGGASNNIGGDVSTIVGGSNNSVEDLAGYLTVIGNSTFCGDFGLPSYDVCVGSLVNADLINSTLRYFSEITDSTITQSSISASNFDITPSSAPTSPSTGGIYVDNSNALCVYLDGAWIKIAGTGSCE